MSETRPLNDAERAELVAFLDGELTGQAKQNVETRINVDPTWRAEALSLRRTWELLDYLPRPEPSPHFTQRTLSKLTPMPPKLKAPPSNGRWRPHWLALVGGWAAAVVLAGVLGYVVMRPGTSSGASEVDLVRDLRIIEHVRAYEVADDVDFLRELDDPDLFGDEGNGG